jgi:hypothetical protein
MSALGRRHAPPYHHVPHPFDVAAIFASYSRLLPGVSAANPSLTFAHEKYSASATDAANLAINAGVFLVEAQQSIPGRYGRGNIGDARLVVTDWRGPDR